MHNLKIILNKTVNKPYYAGISWAYHFAESENKRGIDFCNLQSRIWFKFIGTTNCYKYFLVFLYFLYICFFNISCETKAS